MPLWRRSTLLLLIPGAMWLSGCHSTHAQSTPTQPSLAKAQAFTTPLAKHPPRDSAFSTYNNPTYGVSFRYPRNYLLAEGSDSGASSILDAQQELAAQQPGALFLATVTIPPDAYPNTTFISGSLQLVVNPAVTPESCQSFAAPDDESYRSGSMRSQSVIFGWRQTRSAATDTGSLLREYATFSNGTCYEFFLEVVTASSPDSDPQPPGNANLPIGIAPNSAKAADLPKILRQLEKIISSLQIHPHSSGVSARSASGTH